MLLSHRALMIVMGGVIVALSPRAGADPTGDARKAIQAAYNREAAAANKKDINGAMADYSPDYVSVDKSGTQTNATQSREQMKMVFNMAKSLKLTQSVQNIALKGNQAQVTSNGHLEMLMLDPNTKQSHKLVMDVVSQDTWIKGTKGWLLKRSKSVSEKTTVDGKPMKGSQPGQG